MTLNWSERQIKQSFHLCFLAFQIKSHLVPSVSIFKVKHSLDSWAPVWSSSAISSCDISTQAKSKGQVFKVNPFQLQCMRTKAPTIRKKESQKCDHFKWQRRANSRIQHPERVRLPKKQSELFWNRRFGQRKTRYTAFRKKGAKPIVTGRRVAAHGADSLVFGGPRHRRQTEHLGRSALRTLPHSAGGCWSGSVI